MRRNPTTAAVLGALVPGAGHVYSTEYLRGVGIYLGTTTIIGGGTLMYVIDRCTFAFLNPDPCDPGPQWPHRTLGMLMIASGVGAWVVSAIDAPRAARRANRRHGFRSAQWAPVVQPRLDGKPAVGLGVAATW
ncbi:MAG TPA: hypothetical protein VJW73_10780 [Gemmatimonadaceae bacterium]|nr:hypothetical protein [Gemmatimonadaceae bacterium]